MSRRAQSSADEIQFLEPRDFAFGGEQTADFSGVDIDDIPDADDAAPRSRWLTTAAGLILAGTVGAGIVAAAPWDSPSGTSAPAPTTILPPERRQEPVGTVGVTEPVTGSNAVPDDAPDVAVNAGRSSR